MQILRKLQQGKNRSGSRKHNPVKAGDRIGALVVVSEAGRSRCNHKLWLCKCDCGNECVKQSNNLRFSPNPSCGCIASAVWSSSASTHGMRSSPEYSSWMAAKSRCHNPDSKDYHRYGGRGISMCDEWRNSFQAFYRDMGDRPAGKTLERLDSDGDYERENCTWATPEQQARNRRRSIYVSWQGERKHLSVVADELGISYGAAYQRYKRGRLYGNP